MERDREEWLTTDAAAAEIGMKPNWVRRQILAGRLRATVWKVGTRRVYRIAIDDWVAFTARYSGAADDERFSDEGSFETRKA